MANSLNDPSRPPEGFILNDPSRPPEGFVLNSEANSSSDIYKDIREDQKNRLKAMGRPFLAGATFGLGDEAVGGLTAALLKATGKGGKKSYSELYKEIKNEEQQALQKNREQYPGQSFAAELIPNIATGNEILKGVGLTVRAGDKALKTLGKVTGGGALLGAASGVGEAKNLEETPRKALEKERRELS
jgi:hypothetical protein